MENNLLQNLLINFYYNGKSIGIMLYYRHLKFENNNFYFYLKNN